MSHDINTLPCSISSANDFIFFIFTHPFGQCLLCLWNFTTNLPFFSSTSPCHATNADDTICPSLTILATSLFPTLSIRLSSSVCESSPNTSPSVNGTVGKFIAPNRTVRSTNSDALSILLHASALRAVVRHNESHFFLAPALPTSFGTLIHPQMPRSGHLHVSGWLSPTLPSPTTWPSLPPSWK